MSKSISHSQIFIIYAVPRNGLTDPQAIAQQAFEKDELFKLPVYCEDSNPQTAVSAFTAENPDYMITSIVDLQSLEEEVNFLIQFKTETEQSID